MPPKYVMGHLDFKSSDFFFLTSHTHFNNCIKIQGPGECGGNFRTKMILFD